MQLKHRIGLLSNYKVPNFIIQEISNNLIIPPMNINFQYHNVTASDRLEIYVSQKLDKLFKRYDFVVNADVYFESINTSSVDKGKICKVRLGTPGQTLFTEASHANFETSVNEVTRELETQLKKRKDKFARHQ